GTVRCSSCSRANRYADDLRRGRRARLVREPRCAHFWYRSQELRNMAVDLLWACGLRYSETAIAPDAQTERPGDAGPVRALLGGGAAPAACFENHLYRRATENAENRRN